jgi:hypothetical protein
VALNLHMGAGEMPEIGFRRSKGMRDPPEHRHPCSLLKKSSYRLQSYNDVNYVKLCATEERYTCRYSDRYILGKEGW